MPAPSAPCLVYPSVQYSAVVMLGTTRRTGTEWLRREGPLWLVGGRHCMSPIMLPSTSKDEPTSQQSPKRRRGRLLFCSNGKECCMCTFNLVGLMNDLTKSRQHFQAFRSGNHRKGFRCLADSLGVQVILSATFGVASI